MVYQAVYGVLGRSPKNDPGKLNRVKLAPRLVKRSQALRGRNLIRDSHADGAPMVHRASGGQCRQGPLSLIHRTPELCLRKSRGLGQSPTAVARQPALWHPCEFGAGALS